MPVHGWKSSNFGMRLNPVYHVWRLHAGTDFAAGHGTPIRAAAAGRVVTAGYSGGYGNYTCISHGRYQGRGLSTCYGHQSHIGVYVGQQVRRGEVIGRVGTTGASTGNHLHFEVRAQRRPAQPAELPSRLPLLTVPPQSRPGPKWLAVPRLLWVALPGPAVRRERHRAGRRLVMPREQGRKVVASNRKARHDYAILDTFEAGMALTGTEVKSLRMGRASLVDAFGHENNGEIFLHGMHIPEYTQGTWTNHEPRRVRKLLLKRAEIHKLHRQAQGERPDARAAVGVLQRRLGQGRDRPRQGQEGVRQAAGPGEPGRPARDQPGDGPPQQGHGLTGRPAAPGGRLHLWVGYRNDGAGETR